MEKKICVSIAYFFRNQESNAEIQISVKAWKTDPFIIMNYLTVEKIALWVIKKLFKS